MATAFQKRLASLAKDQYRRYRLVRENQAPLAAQIETYWTDLGLAFSGVQTAWSAVFVSWCVRQAGATADQFVFSMRHGDFVHAAIANTARGQGVFRGHRVETHAPKVGDLLQNNRAGHRYDFDYAASHRRYESHSAIVVEVGADPRGGYLRTIGGNEGDSIGLKEVRLDPDGCIRNPDGLHICVIETLL